MACAHPKTRSTELGKEEGALWREAWPAPHTNTSPGEHRVHSLRGEHGPEAPKASPAAVLAGDSRVWPAIRSLHTMQHRTPSGHLAQ